ncbi:AAA family ATPase [Paenibacillus sp. 1001270B_150601_E10]|uniref:AAA family ATPase n=1 Tax=Paenibacillus sp. 1001270B_150601_E10 TaxID=2787079 RepID=UPI00189FD1D6|nr:MoxR family ATPase [Paenibacillus sp. 1001270B_150601_E10]
MNKQITLHSIIQQLQESLQSSILGKPLEINLLLTAMLAKGHVLIEDVPGTGKTQLIKSIARTINGQFRRVQCNPDLLPTDITGMFIFHPKDQQFIFRPGPMMTNVLLVDEINRATTKTQSALLEAMEERHVTIEGETFELPSPFMLFATQNPIEFEGTYVLPEAQMDRFMMKISLGYPDELTEREMLARHVEGLPSERVDVITDVSMIEEVQRLVEQVHMDDAIGSYIIDITRRTREHAHVLLGASPRASIALMQAAKAYAWLSGREYVSPDDVKMLVPHVLGHRLVLTIDAKIDGVKPHKVLREILDSVTVPVRLGM